ncbi:MAG: transcriptional regulator [Marmoricola sp.]
MSAMLVTVSFVLAEGMALLSATSIQAGARSGLLVMSLIVGLLGIIGVRLIHAKSLVTPWVLVGGLPALLGWLLTR